MAFPVIDLNQFPDPEGYKRLREASEQWGCFRLVNHKIPLSLMSEMKKVVRSLLDLPTEIKKNNTDVIYGSGYVAPSKVNPLNEGLGLCYLGSSETVHTFCSQLGASSYQREVIEKYAEAVYEQMMDLGDKLAQSFELQSDFLKEWLCQFRFNKYNFTSESVGSPGLELHTDSGFLTILQDDESVGGLEVMDRQSGALVPVDPCPGTFVVNVGDTAKAWSNGRLCNGRHRVQCKEGSVRVSIAFLLLGPKEEAVEAPLEFVDSEHPRLYVPFTYEEFRMIRLSKHLRDGDALELVRIKS
ncbi:putative gibberellin 3-beta-dioxygenase [Rosa chinensis]|uniref:2-oxoglutarate-dependent dioxygenase DAO n=1 Tax=Rosa chinensis TaxID=74649 RepID=A0A2P6RKZ0_ROSCH|nr:2-oxoglutarate-dependent dioxygenase DAO [Rosa chinensis]PRQ47108.1 putative gibberellin 3-beta-dioxygenase [Rosa chinensis]